MYWPLSLEGLQSIRALPDASFKHFEPSFWILSVSDHAQWFCQNFEALLRFIRHYNRCLAPPNIRFSKLFVG